MEAVGTIDTSSFILWKFLKASVMAVRNAIGEEFKPRLLNRKHTWSTGFFLGLAMIVVSLISKFYAFENEKDLQLMFGCSYTDFFDLKRSFRFFTSTFFIYEPILAGLSAASVIKVGILLEISPIAFCSGIVFYGGIMNMSEILMNRFKLGDAYNASSLCGFSRVWPALQVLTTYMISRDECSKKGFWWCVFWLEVLVGYMFEEWRDRKEDVEVSGVTISLFYSVIALVIWLFFIPSERCKNTGIMTKEAEMSVNDDIWDGSLDAKAQAQLGDETDEEVTQMPEYQSLAQTEDEFYQKTYTKYMQVVQDIAEKKKDLKYDRLMKRYLEKDLKKVWPFVERRRIRRMRAQNTAE